MLFFIFKPFVSLLRIDDYAWDDRERDLSTLVEMTGGGERMTWGEEEGIVIN